MTATIKGVSALSEACEVGHRTDSKYLNDGINKWVHGWKKRGWKNASKGPVRDAELWNELIELTAHQRVHWHWVKGHSGHPENDRVDQLASDAAEQFARAD